MDHRNFSPDGGKPFVITLIEETMAKMARSGGLQPPKAGLVPLCTGLGHVVAWHEYDTGCPQWPGRPINTYDAEGNLLDDVGQM